MQHSKSRSPQKAALADEHAAVSSASCASGQRLQTGVKDCIFVQKFARNRSVYLAWRKEKKEKKRMVTALHTPEV